MAPQILLSAGYTPDRHQGIVEWGIGLVDGYERDATGLELVGQRTQFELSWNG